MSKVIGAGFDFAKSMHTFPGSPGTVINSDSAATQDVYGAYAQIIADIGVDDIYLDQLISRHNTGGTATGDFVVAIAIGGSGSEVIFITVGGSTIQNQEEMVNIDLGHTRVPAGSRLAIKHKDNEAATRSINHTINYSKV